jgi:3-oxoacyl-[acyl-carrier protein] reductase
MTSINDDRKVALVTGASRGIGAATARRLAADGYRVVLAARGTDALDAVRTELVSSGGDALAVPTDLTDTSAIDELLAATDEWGFGLDLLVNNAGVLPTATRVEHLALDDWHHTLMLNMTSPFYLASRAHRLMKNGSVVVNVSSTAAFYPSVGLCSYNVSKAALNMLTRCLALEWARDGIRVVGVSPGKIDTELVEPIMEWVDRTEQKVNLLDRLGAAEEVAELIAYLASDRAAYLTGSMIAIDGGELLTAGTGVPR